MYVVEYDGAPELYRAEEPASDFKIRVMRVPSMLSSIAALPQSLC